jgi:hypothetical protein
VKILNQPTPPAFRESVRVGEQNLYIRSKELVGDRNPREEEFSIQMWPMDADKTGLVSAFRCSSPCAAVSLGAIRVVGPSSSER